MAKKKAPKSYERAFKDHAYSAELEQIFRDLMREHLAHELKLFTHSLYALSQFQIPEHFIREELDRFDAAHREDGRGAAVGVQHHVNRIIHMWKSGKRPPPRASTAPPMEGL